MFQLPSTIFIVIPVYAFRPSSVTDNLRGKGGNPMKKNFHVELAHNFPYILSEVKRQHLMLCLSKINDINNINVQ